MKRIILFGLILFVFFTGCAYYPVKKEIKLNNLSKLSKEEKFAFNMIIDKEEEIEISTIILKEIENLISLEFKKKGFEIKKDSNLLLMVKVIDYKKGNAALRFFLSFGAGQIKIKAKITMMDLTTNEILFQTEIESKTSSNPFNWSSSLGTEEGVQKKFAKAVVTALAN